VSDVLFPEQAPPPPKPKPPWEPGELSRRVLDVLKRRGPKDEDEIGSLLVGEVERRRLPRILDELAEHGRIADTGGRAEKWRKGNRLIIWRFVEQPPAVPSDGPERRVIALMQADEAVILAALFEVDENRRSDDELVEVLGTAYAAGQVRTEARERGLA
jgi:hypothetical protein